MIVDKDKFLEGLDECKHLLDRTYVFFDNQKYDDCETSIRRLDARLKKLISDHLPLAKILKEDSKDMEKWFMFEGTKDE